MRRVTLYYNTHTDRSDGEEHRARPFSYNGVVATFSTPRGPVGAGEP
jgi:hypothetical protein